MNTNLETAMAIWLAADAKAKKQMELATELKNKATELYTQAFRDMMNAGTLYEQACYKESLVNNDE